MMWCVVTKYYGRNLSHCVLGDISTYIYIYICVCVCVCVCVTYNKGVGSGFGDVYNSYRIMTKRLLPK